SVPGRAAGAAGAGPGCWGCRGRPRQVGAGTPSASSRSWRDYRVGGVGVGMLAVLASAGGRDVRNGGVRAAEKEGR
ncbi:MAG: hypothetical protein M0Z46_06900, partial [Actinomycetota bacterium]|nr:hypothetical protein [Actinomycetota bacterium]